ncbi:MAG: hypothetical protein PHX79_05955 [Sphaerochaetaceae bacterium]|nr:hypothetical protein [Sphaerochaetaceae bacterium]
MPKKNFETVGVLQRFTYVNGVIKERILQGDSEHAESEWDTCTVEIKGHEHAGVPIFYNCDRKEGDPEIEILDNGSLKNAASAFLVDDEVVVLQDLKDNTYVVISHVGEKRKCHAIWEPWGGVLTKNHNWIIVNNALPCSVSTDPIYNTYYYVSIPSTGSTSRWQSHLVKWGDISDPGYGSHPSTPSDIPFDGITFSNCKVILDIEGLSFYISHPDAIQSGIGLYFYGADIAYGFFFHISYETPIITGVREFDLSAIFAGVDTLMTGMSIEYVVETGFFEPPVTYTFAMGLALNYIDIVRV